QDNQEKAEMEYESADYLANDEVHPTYIIELPEALKIEVASAMKPLIEEWAGTEIVLSAVYGIRRYHRGTVLTPHRDRIDSHILSAIINVDQQVDQEWPLEIEDNYYRPHKIFLKPGEMILYESARLMHGRATPLNGDYYDNLFVHFRPITNNGKEALNTP
ncbi:MAG: prolyl hydroxylase family protein, partial [bacterium]